MGIILENIEQVKNAEIGDIIPVSNNYWGARYDNMTAIVEDKKDNGITLVCKHISGEFQRFKIEGIEKDSKSGSPRSIKDGRYCFAITSAVNNEQFESVRENDHIIKKYLGALN
jgi:hypothetical protein